MASTIKVKRSAVQGKAPTAGNLETGEIALNTRDGRLYSKGTQVFEVGANTHSLFVGAGGATFANGAYTFPTADGSANQILQTDGSGTLSFVDNTGGAGGGVANSYLTSTFTTNTEFQSALANTNAYIAFVSATERSALANTNSYIATKVNSSNPTITGALSANGSVGTSGYVLKSAGAGNPAYWDVSSGGATIQTMPFYNSSGSLDTITISGSSFTFYDSTGTADSIDISTDINLNSLADVSVAAPSLNQVLRYNGTSWVSSDSAGASWSALTSTNTAIRTLVGQNLANTNTYIATKLDSSSYTTADVQSKAALANTNAYIATKLDSSSYTTADVQSKSALANTNAYIASKAPTASPTFTGDATFDTNTLFVDSSAGNVGIGDSAPLDKVHIYEDVNSATATQLLLQNEGAGNHAAGIAFQVSSSGETTGFAPKAGIVFERQLSNGRGSLKFFNDIVDDANGFSATDEVMRIDSAGDITTAGSITPGSYNTGQVIEELHAVCNTTSLHGRATIQNVTTSQAIAESYGDATGSVVTSYTPPSGTKMIVYEYTAHLRWEDAHAISHWRLYYQIDGGSWTEVTNARTNRNGYYPEDKQIMRWVFEVGAGSTTAADGIFSAATPVLGFKWQCRDYAAANERGSLHLTQYWDGGATDVFSKPMIMVKAIA